LTGSSVVPKRRPTAVVAEDDSSVAKALTRLLRINFDVLAVVSDGETLVERAVALRPDIVVSDVGLERLDGISATRQIHMRCPEMPIVLLTGRLDPILDSKAIEAGAAVLLRKPNDIDLTALFCTSSTFTLEQLKARTLVQSSDSRTSSG
jgi:CheY-like chemotaxis protein